MKKLLYFFPFLYLLFLLVHVERALTQDLGRHIKLGEVILSLGMVPATNYFSYSMPDHEFINHHWLGEVFFFILSRAGGIEAIIIWKILFIFASFGVLFFLARELGGKFWASVCALPFLYIWSYRFDSRPEVFSFLFLSLFLFFIYLYSKTKSWWYLVALIPLQILWVNSHIYFFVGIAVYGAFVFTEFLLGRSSKKLAFVGVLMVGSVFINPYFAQGAIAPLVIFFDYGYTIVENQSIVFLNSWFFTPHVLVFEVLVVMLVVLALLTLSKRYIFWYLVTIFGVVASFSMIRNLPLFVILAYPAATIVLSCFEKKFVKEKKVARAIVLSFLVVLIGVHVARGIMSPAFGFFYIDAGERAVDFIESRNLEGPIFNNFDVGSYLIYRLYPRERVFVDGRPEAYTSDFFDEYKRMQEEWDFFEEKSDEYNFEMIVFSRTDITPWAQTFFQQLAAQNKWVEVYADSYYIIFVKRESENLQRTL